MLFPSTSIPINGLHRLNLQLGNAFQRNLDKALVLSVGIWRRLARRLRWFLPKKALNLDRLRGQRFQDLLADGWANLLLAEGSGSSSAFRRDSVEKLLCDAGANDIGAVRSVGALVTAELFLVHARRACAMGRERRPAAD